jgi:hypothetical protein
MVTDSPTEQHHHDARTHLSLNHRRGRPGRAAAAGENPVGVGPGPLSFGYVSRSERQERRQVGQRAACENDAMRLCSEFGGDVQRITTCMSQNMRYLNPQCRVYFDGKRRSR